MRKSYLISVIALILTLAVFTVAFSLYRRDADDKEVSISFGEIAELTIGGSTETSTVNPELNGSFTVNLLNQKSNADMAADLYTHGRFYVEVLQKTENADKQFADEIIVKATVLSGSKQGKIIPHNDLVKVGESVPKGFVSELIDDPVQVEITYELSDEAKTNFFDYAEQQISIILHWDFCESDTIKVNVYRKWERVYYELDGKIAQVMFTNGQPWAQIEVDKDATVRFASDEEMANNVIDVPFASYTVNELWVTLDEADLVHTTEPSGC